MSMDEAEIEAQALHDQRKRERAEITRLRADRDALLAVVTNFANESNWNDAVACLQWVGKRHALEYAQSTLAAIKAAEEGR